MTAEAPRAVFVVSNGTHVQMFAGVAAELERRGWATTFVDLDAHYQLGARSAAGVYGRVTVPLDRRGARPDRRFYDRSTLAIWRDVVRTRPIVRRILLKERPNVVVLGNDRGLLERLFISAARSMGIRTAVVQDGVLGVGRPPERSIVRRLRHRGRHVASVGLRRIGLGYLASVEHGQGGADLVCASGEHGRAVFLAHGVRTDSIVVTGQPRYDTLAALPAATRRDGVTWFTTPFAEQGLGETESRQQAQLVSEVATALRGMGVPFVVRPHPAEDARRYRALAGNLEIAGTEPIEEVLSRTRVAIVGMSTVVDAAALAGVPVLVPGRRIHGHRFSALLPDAGAYPRFESGAELVAHLPNTPGLLAAQQAEVARSVSVLAGYPSACRVADAISNVHR